MTLTETHFGAIYIFATRHKKAPKALTFRAVKELRGPDLNRRPPGYEPDELPGCSTPHGIYGAECGRVQVIF